VRETPDGSERDAGTRYRFGSSAASAGMAATPATRARLRSVGVVLGVALLGLGVGAVLVLVTLLGLRFGGVELTPLLLLVVSLLLFQGVTMGGVAIAYMRYRGLTLDYVGLGDVFGDPLRDGVAVAVGWVLSLGAAFTAATLASLVGAQGGTNQAAEIAAQDPEVLLFLIPGAFLLIGPGEELLFRGIIQGRLRESFGPAAGVVIAAALFAAVHVAAVTGGLSARLVSVAILFPPSLVFGAAYELTDNLAVPALIHGAYNATLFALLYVALKFMDLSLPESGGALLVLAGLV